MNERGSCGAGRRRPGKSGILAGLPGAGPFVVLLLLLGCCKGDGSGGAGRAAGPAAGEVVLEMGGATVTLEVAATTAARNRGLMYRQELPQDRGMLFVYPEAQVLSFWMKNTLIPLSIAFLRDDGTVVNVEEMRPLLTAKRYVSGEPCRFAIEMNPGWFAEHGLGAGSAVALPREILELPSE